MQAVEGLSLSSWSSNRHHAESSSDIIAGKSLQLVEGTSPVALFKALEPHVTSSWGRETLERTENQLLKLQLFLNTLPMICTESVSRGDFHERVALALGHGSIETSSTLTDPATLKLSTMMQDIFKFAEVQLSWKQRLYKRFGKGQKAVVGVGVAATATLAGVLLPVVGLAIVVAGLAALSLCSAAVSYACKNKEAELRRHLKNLPATRDALEKYFLHLEELCTSYLDCVFPEYGRPPQPLLGNDILQHLESSAQQSELQRGVYNLLTHVQKLLRN
eukprot:jgi/Chlat1/1167/Chrsp113S01636